MSDMVAGSATFNPQAPNTKPSSPYSSPSVFKYTEAIKEILAIYCDAERGTESCKNACGNYPLHEKLRKLLNK